MPINFPFLLPPPSHLPFPTSLPPSLPPSLRTPFLPPFFLLSPSSFQISEAKVALTQHLEMLQELNEWEERQRNRDLLTSGVFPLSGHRVSVCNVQTQSWITGVTTAHNINTKVRRMVDLVDLSHCSSDF